MVEMGIVLLAYASLPYTYWTNVFFSIVYRMNVLPKKVLRGMSPSERLNGQTLDYKRASCVWVPLLSLFETRKSS